ncbi:MFS transporter, partial [bacterium]|nr:MFS transporter [bacterium]
MEAIKNMFRALRHRNYAVFCSGQIISLIGTWMQTMALGWLVYRLTGSSTHLGAVTFCDQIPVLLLVSWGGIIADRYPKRTVLLWTQSLFLILTGAIAALTLTNHIAIWHIYLLSLLLGIVTAVDMPTRQAFIVHMVEGHDDLSNAIILNSSMVNSARLIGPSVAGMMVAWVGEGQCFLLNSLSYLAVLASLICITVDGFAPSNIAESPWESML